MEKDLKHFGIPGMRWGVRRNRPGSVGTTISTNSPLRGRMKPLIGKETRAKAKNAVDKALGEQIGLKRISELKSKEVTVTWQRGRYLSTVALAVVGAWKVGEWLAKATYG